MLKLLDDRLMIERLNEWGILNLTESEDSGGEDCESFDSQFQNSDLQENDSQDNF
jgi:hypothetical protein